MKTTLCVLTTAAALSLVAVGYSSTPPTSGAQQQASTVRQARIEADITKAAKQNDHVTLPSLSSLTGPIGEPSPARHKDARAKSAHHGTHAVTHQAGADKAGTVTLPSLSSLTSTPASSGGR